ncbi:MAG: thioredoxin family protein [Bacteroidales bacterium]|nr:thioredoxin family protein [Bacteroidales bacterium]
MIVKTSLLIAGIFILFNPVFSQEESNLKEENESKEYIAGKVDRKVLQTGEFGKHFQGNYKNYHPDNKILQNLKNSIFNYKIQIVMATWCHDSQVQVPRFFKILDQLDYNTNLIEIICVDRNKAAANFDLANLNIERVPTFIFYKDDTETGRIIETPVTSLEQDTFIIFNK